jgi:hypothetical protein
MRPATCGEIVRNRRHVCFGPEVAKRDDVVRPRDTTSCALVNSIEERLQLRDFRCRQDHLLCCYRQPGGQMGPRVEQHFSTVPRRAISRPFCLYSTHLSWQHWLVDSRSAPDWACRLGLGLSTASALLSTHPICTTTILSRVNCQSAVTVVVVLPS